MIQTHEEYVALKGNQTPDPATLEAIAEYEAGLPDLAAVPGDPGSFLEWYTGRKADYASQKVRLKAQYEAMLRDIERQEEGLDYHFADRAERELRAQLTGRSRSVKFLTGTIGLRKKPGSVNGADVPLELWPEEAQSAIVTKVDGTLLKKVVKVVGEKAYLAETGEPLELPGLRVTPESEAMYIKTGKEEL